MRLLLPTSTFTTLVVLAACAPTAAPPGAPKGELNIPPVGSKWVLAERNTGSYGSSSGQLTVARLADQTWQGRPVRVYSDGTVAVYVDAATAALVARVRGTTPLESYDPPLGWKWPIWVGQSWLHTYRYTDHVRGRSFDNVQVWFKVEAYEDVTVPAGKFKAFKVRFDSGGGSTIGVSWWNPELGVTVKSRTERAAGQYLGPGVRETEMVSYEIKR